MTRDEQLEEKFQAHLKTYPGYEATAGVPSFRSSPTFAMWRRMFFAGANAAMDMQFEPGAVRFGEDGAIRPRPVPDEHDLGGES